MAESHKDSSSQPANGGPVKSPTPPDRIDEPPSLDALFNDVKHLEHEADKYRELELSIAKHEDTCTREFARIDKELRSRLAELKRAERGARRGSILSLKKSSSDKEQSPEQTRLIALGTTIRHRLSLLRGTLPQPPGLLLGLSLGRPTPSHIRTHAARIAYKTSYETFKLRATIFSSTFALINLFFPSVRVLDTIFMFCLLYYYSTLTLREHVLSANGSNIRTWWLAHHILTAVMTGMLLIWPASSTSYHRFRPLFYSYAMYLGLVQYLQYKYQTARLYALRSLGQTNSMETIAGGEGSTVIGGREVEWLVPYLIGGWVWQGVCAFWGAKLWYEENWDGGDRGPWQALGVGMIFLVLGVGNAWMTYITFKEKAVADK